MSKGEAYCGVCTADFAFRCINQMNSAKPGSKCVKKDFVYTEQVKFLFGFILVQCPHSTITCNQEMK